MTASSIPLHLGVIAKNLLVPVVGGHNDEPPADILAPEDFGHYATPATPMCRGLAHLHANDVPRRIVYCQYLAPVIPKLGGESQEIRAKVRKCAADATKPAPYDRRIKNSRHART
jgi:hypothetical protein